MLVGRCARSEFGHAPFRRVIELAVSRSVLVTVSFPGRACHPLTIRTREGMAMTIVESTRPVTGGVDTHLDSHVAAAVDANGGLLGVESFPTTTAGFIELHEWLASFGTLTRVGVEGTGAYGAGLARCLRAMDVTVIEVGRPNRQAPAVLRTICRPTAPTFTRDIAWPDKSLPSPSSDPSLVCQHRCQIDP